MENSFVTAKLLDNGEHQLFSKWNHLSAIGDRKVLCYHLGKILVFPSSLYWHHEQVLSLMPWEMSPDSPLRFLWFHTGEIGEPHLNLAGTEGVSLGFCWLQKDYLVRYTVLVNKLFLYRHFGTIFIVFMGVSVRRLCSFRLGCWYKRRTQELVTVSFLMSHSPYLVFLLLYIFQRIFFLYNRRNRKNCFYLSMSRSLEITFKLQCHSSYFFWILDCQQDIICHWELILIVMMSSPRVSV